jgi:hypothetical protein
MTFAGFIVAIIVIVVLIALALGGWVAYTHIRARRLGLPTPTLSSYNPFASRDDSYTAPHAAPGGIVGWINDKMRAFKNRNNRSAGGAYEEPLSSFGGGGTGGAAGNYGGRGFGPLDPDDAWDSRVGNEADQYGLGGHYGEDQESGVRHDVETGYAGAVGTTGGEDRGRVRSREPDVFIGGGPKGMDRRYDEEMGTGAAKAAKGVNPFDDEAEPSTVSLRGVSPRPIENVGKGHKTNESLDESPNERRSMFRENM